VVSITDSAVGMIRVKGTRTAARTSSACAYIQRFNFSRPTSKAPQLGV